MNFRKQIISAIVFSLAALASAAQAQEMAHSGFMTDYTQLEKVTDGTADYRYIAPGAEDRMRQYEAVMIDQPEIFIADDSPYKGIKPRHLNALAESLRAGIASGLSDDMYIVDEPGEKVLYLSIALTNLKQTKKKRKLLEYTPAGFIAGSVLRAATSDIAKKANLQSVVLEWEVFDSVTKERLVGIIDSLGAEENTLVSWSELEELMARYGKLMSCNFNNAKVPESQRTNCLAAE